MDNIYLTNEVANILDVSIGTVRNYAKSLERAGYEFDMRKQARVWTNKEIQLINEVQEFYHEFNYTLDQSFMYVVALHQDGKEYADSLLNDFTPTSFTSQQPTPQLDYLQGIRTDTKAIIDRFDALQSEMLTKDDLKADNEELHNLQSELEKAKNNIRELTSKNEKLEFEKEELEKQLHKVKQMTTFEFWKFKKE